MIGDKLEKLRLSYGLTQKQLAKKFNILKSSISMYENNVRKPPNEIIEQYADFFEVSTDYIYGRLKPLESELEEINFLEKMLIKKGIITEGEELTKEQINRLFNFIMANKKFILSKDEPQE